MIPAVPVFSALRRDRLALALCAAGLTASAALGCGDDMADPIVRLAESRGGQGGSGGLDNGDPGDLCAPCSTRYDCNAMESCVELSRGGERFCSHACENGSGGCPQGYVCSDVYNVSSFECVPQTGDCNSIIVF